MKIDRDRVTEAFNNYVAKFDESDEMIRLKKKHTVKVATNADEIAGSIGLSSEEVDICWLIGMLHDIARFRQLKEYHTLYDAKSFNHAYVGCDILFKEGLIDSFVDYTVEDSRTLSLVENAVRWHSEYRIPEDLDEEEKQYCNIIRDADKVDIFRVAIEEPVNNVYSVTRRELLDSEITPEVLEAFYEHHAVKRELRKNMLDIKVGFVSLSFELVYDKSKELALSQGNLMNIIEDDYTNERTRQQVREIQRELEEYLKE